MIEIITVFTTLLPSQSWLAAPSPALHHPATRLQSPCHGVLGLLGAFSCPPKAKGLGVLCLQCAAFEGSSSWGVSDQPEQRTPCIVLVLWVCLCFGDEEGGSGSLL